MPELPEVEVVRRGAAPHLLGATIRAVDVRHVRATRRHEPGPADFADRLVGRRIDGIARRGKFLWLVLDDSGPGDDAVMLHLGMSGQLRIDAEGAVPVAAVRGEGPASDPDRHTRLVLDLAGADGAGVRLRFVDQRMFGGAWVSPLVETGDGAPAGAGTDLALAPAALGHVARDLLDPHLDRKGAVARLRTRRAAVKSLLLSQDIVSGIGNIYADEGLWAARVHFAQDPSLVSAAKLSRLLDATEAVMRRALAAGGTSFDELYVDVAGRSGYFANRLDVYKRAGQPCNRCGTTIKRVAFMNRSSHFCPRCQRRR